MPDVTKDRGPLGLEGQKKFVVGDVPQSRGFVRTPSQYARIVPAKLRAVHDAVVFEGLERLGLVRVPQPRRLVIAPSQHLSRCRCSKQQRASSSALSARS